MGPSSQAEHLGLLPNQPAFDGKVQPTTNMHPAPVLNEYDFGSSEDLAVQDILSDVFQTLWHGTGEKNREAFKAVFLPVPSNEIKNWKQYDEFLKPHAGVSVCPSFWFTALLMR
jgi:phospholipase D1/2